ncbi:hypothetical protein L7F22_063117 [Adiantum nelumboides]|nr:hypothetical protein [Adiantum nelumboides]
MRCARHALQRARMARVLVSGGKQNCRGAINLVQIPEQAIFLANHATRLLDGSTFSSGSVTVFEGQPAATIDGQQAPAKTGPLYQYERRVEMGELMAGDQNQERALKALQTLYDGLLENSKAMELDDAHNYHDSRQRSWFWTSFLSKGKEKPHSSVKGLYLYGGVGTGKTMLMDLFYEELPKRWKKRRTHFHDFMLNVHSRLQKQKGMSDPLQVVAEELSKEAILLCLDEFMVTDVADALILNRLFQHLFERGIVLVTTSNRAPNQLYEGGLQRDLFLPFIALLKARCIVHEIGSSVDYRKLNANEEGFFFHGEGAGSLLREKFRLITDGNLAKPTVVEVVMGRKLQVRDYFDVNLKIAVSHE